MSKRRLSKGSGKGAGFMVNQMAQQNDQLAGDNGRLLEENEHLEAEKRALKEKFDNLEEKYKKLKQKNTALARRVKELEHSYPESGESENGLNCKTHGKQLLAAAKKIVQLTDELAVVTAMHKMSQERKMSTSVVFPPTRTDAPVVHAAPSSSSSSSTKRRSFRLSPHESLRGPDGIIKVPCHICHTIERNMQMCQMCDQYFCNEHMADEFTCVSCNHYLTANNNGLSAQDRRFMDDALSQQVGIDKDDADDKRLEFES